MTEIFRVRIERKLIDQASKVAEEIGTTPGEVVRMLFKQMAKRRTIPFPLHADVSGELDDILGSSERRAKLWDEMNEGKPANR